MENMKFLFYPDGKEAITKFYFVYMSIYLLIHFLWDWLSPQTPAFSAERFSARGLPMVFNAATFATSLLLLLALWHNTLASLLGDTTLPLIVAGFSGMIQSFSALVPPKAKSE